jgi:hypothetical protein
MRMALNMPIAAFDGISLSLLPREGGSADMLAVMLKHSDPSLTLPLFLTSQPYEALAEWRAWSEVLGMPRVLAKERSASVSMAHFGQLHIERPRPRRRRRSALKARRPSILLRRGFGRVTEATPVHRGEREIIARKLAFAPLQLQGAAFHDQFDMVGIHFPQNVRGVAGTDLSRGEFVDNAIARRTFRGDRAIAVAGHAAVAVGALVSDEFDDPFTDAVDRAFLRICALAPPALDRIGLCQCRRDKDTEE